MSLPPFFSVFAHPSPPRANKIRSACLWACAEGCAARLQMVTLRPILAKVYGEKEVVRWTSRWRGFFLACSELFRPVICGGG